MANVYKVSENQIDFDKWSEAKEVILSKISLRSVMAKYGVVSTASHVMASCLFHDENIPSMSVSFDEGVWHCFSCQRGGTAIDLIRHTETALHNNFLDRYTVVEFILQRYPDIAKILGYNSILKDPDDSIDLSDDSVLNDLNIEVGEQLVAKCQAVEGLSKICADLNSRLQRCRASLDTGMTNGFNEPHETSKRSDSELEDVFDRFSSKPEVGTSLFAGNEVDSDDLQDVLNRILFVCEACELGLPESYISDKLRSKSFEDPLRIAQESIDLSEKDAEVLEDLLM